MILHSIVDKILFAGTYIFYKTTKLEADFLKIDELICTCNLFVSELVYFVKGPKDTEQLSVKGYLFEKHYRTGTNQYWMCSKRYTAKCKRRCATTDDGKLILSQNLQHTHPPPEFSTRELLRSNILHRLYFEYLT